MLLSCTSSAASSSSVAKTTLMRVTATTALGCWSPFRRPPLLYAPSSSSYCSSSSSLSPLSLSSSLIWLRTRRQPTGGNSNGSRRWLSSQWRKSPLLSLHHQQERQQLLLRSGKSRFYVSGVAPVFSANFSTINNNNNSNRRGNRNDEALRTVGSTAEYEDFDDDMEEEYDDIQHPRRNKAKGKRPVHNRNSKYKDHSNDRDEKNAASEKSPQQKRGGNSSSGSKRRAFGKDKTKTMTDEFAEDEAGGSHYGQEESDGRRKGIPASKVRRPSSKLLSQLLFEDITVPKPEDETRKNRAVQKPLPQLRSDTTEAALHDEEIMESISRLENRTSSEWESNLFYQKGLAAPLCEALFHQGILKPTSWQAEILDELLHGEKQTKFIRSATGTGKSLLLVLNILNAYYLAGKSERKPNPKTIFAMVIVPTMELGFQITRWMNTLCPSVGLVPSKGDIQFVYKENDERDMENQVKQLKSMTPKILIGTPTRILDLIKSGDLDLKALRPLPYIVLEEADLLVKPLSKFATATEIKHESKHPSETKIVLSGFITKNVITKKTKMIAASATLSSTTRGSLQKFGFGLSGETTFFTNGPPMGSPKMIQHRMIVVDDDSQKITVLKELITDMKPKLGMVIVANDRSILHMWKVLEKKGIRAMPLINAMSKSLYNNSENPSMELDLSNIVDEVGQLPVLIAKETSCRGIDLPCSHVFILDCPTTPNTYLHASGRTGRVNHTESEVILILHHGETAPFQRWKEQYFSFSLQYGIREIKENAQEGLYESDERFFKNKEDEKQNKEQAKKLLFYRALDKTLQKEAAEATSPTHPESNNTDTSSKAI